MQCDQTESEWERRLIGWVQRIVCRWFGHNPDPRPMVPPAAGINYAVRCRRCRRIYEIDRREVDRWRQ